MNESIILATKNADFSELNKEIIQKINGPTKSLSVDSAEYEYNENLTSILSLGPLQLNRHRAQHGT